MALYVPASLLSLPQTRPPQAFWGLFYALRFACAF
jgi:hypothetical protein